MTEILSALDEAQALEDLHRNGCTDGLPVVIPTAERVSRMVLASGQDSDMVLGTMGPGHGIATIENVAIAAVMAGCLPDYMPVVLAAVKAVIDPVFDLTEMQEPRIARHHWSSLTGPPATRAGPLRRVQGL